jgi:hypothetical protein
MKKLHAAAIAIGLPVVTLITVWGMLAGAPAQAAPPDRPLLAPGDCVVTSTADSGPGSLRQCMAGLVAGATITFNTSIFPPTNPASISLASSLPDITLNNITIDGSNAGVILDGSGIGTTPDALLLDDFSLTLDGGSNLIANGDFSAGLGHWRAYDEFPGATSALTSEAHSSPNAYQWSTVAHARESHLVYDTTDTSAPLDADTDLNDASTLWIPATGGSTLEVRFWHKYGTDYMLLEIHALYADGEEDGINDVGFGWQANWTEEVITQTLPDDAVGVTLEFNYAHSLRWVDGMVIGSSGNTVRGLRIANFPNSAIRVSGGAQNNTIGGDRTAGAGPLGQGNLISGNGGCGIRISDSGTMSNTVRGNFIGTDVSGSSALGNDCGIRLENGASYNTIGGSNTALGGHCTGDCNLISGNGDGLLIDGASTNNIVSGNYVGTDVSGTAALGNESLGIGVGGSYNVIGGVNATPGGNCTGECNLFSANDEWGIFLSDNALSNTVSGNYVGTDVSGTMDLGNEDGIGIHDQASYNLIGGDTPGERNLISGSEDYGVDMRGSDVANNTVSGNYIGTNAAGTAAIANDDNGVFIGNGASGNLIGGATAGERNLISGNGGNGVNILGSGTMSNTVRGNFIGTNPAGTAAIGNVEAGVSIGQGASYNVVGGDTPGERNLISGNQTQGVFVDGNGSLGNVIHGNTIGTDVSGSYALPNGDHGVLVLNGAAYTWIEDNLVSGNVANGVGVGRGAMDNTVSGNTIGTNITGTAAISNARSGVSIFRGAHDNMIGPNNVIAYNGDAGVWIGPFDGPPTVNNTITQNSIFSNANEGIDLTDGGNLELFPPILTSVSTHTVEGLAPPNSTVEIFSDAADEGRYYHGSTAADASGVFTFSQTGAFTGTNVTATATDGDGNTSEFSAGYAPLVDVQVVAILQPKASGKQGESVTPTVKVGNAGTTQATGISVAVSASGSALGGPYAPSAQRVDLPPLGYATLTFPALTPAAAGSYDFTASVSLGGDQDPDNDTQTQAVAVASDVIDLWTRDNPADSGDIPTSNFWQSPDLWVRRTCDGGIQHQDPLAGQPNCVYMRVRNRGSAESNGADTARVYWHEPSLGIKCGDWAPIGDRIISATLAHTGTQLLIFTWTPTRTGHTCLQGEIVSNDDPVAYPCDIAWDNNLSQRNVDIIPGGSGLSAQAAGGIVFEVTNIKDKPKPVTLVVDVSAVTDTNAVRLDLGSDLAARWASVDGLTKSSGIAWSGGSLVTVTNHTSGTIAGLPMAAGETQTVTLLVNAPSVKTTTVTIYEAIDAGPGVALADAVVGGNTYIFNTKSDTYLPVILKKR